MRLLLLLITLTTYSSYSYGECTDSPTDIELNTLTMTEPSIYVNGSLRIATGLEPATLIDVYSQDGTAFSGISSYTTVQRDTDTRNAFMRLVFPKEPQPPQYFLTLKPSSLLRERIQGKQTAKVYVSIRGSRGLVKGAFFIDSGISWNCRPILKEKPNLTRPKS